MSVSVPNRTITKISGIMQKHGIGSDYFLDFVSLYLYDTITDEQFEVRLRTADNYKACLKEIFQVGHGVALKYMGDGC
jgi:hypothetical protein